MKFPIRMRHRVWVARAAVADRRPVMSVSAGWTTPVFGASHRVDLSCDSDVGFAAFCR